MKTTYWLMILALSFSLSFGGCATTQPVRVHVPDYGVVLMELELLHKEHRPYQFMVDQRLIEIWGGRKKTDEILDSACRSLRELHGGIFFPPTVCIGLVTDKGALKLMQQKNKEAWVGATTFRRENVVWTLIYDQPEQLGLLFHELAHANLSMVEMPLLFNEGIAYVSDALMRRQYLDPAKHVLDIAAAPNPKEMTPQEIDFLGHRVVVEGVESKDGHTAPALAAKVLQHKTAAGTMWQILRMNLCDGNVIRDFIYHIYGSKGFTINKEEANKFFAGYKLPKPINELTLFSEAKPGLRVSLYIDCGTPYLLVVSRGKNGEFKKCTANLRSGKLNMSINMPEGIAKIEIYEVLGHSNAIVVTDTEDPTNTDWMPVPMVVVVKKK